MLSLRKSCIICRKESRLQQKTESKENHKCGTDISKYSFWEWRTWFSTKSRGSIWGQITPVCQPQQEYDKIVYHSVSKTANKKCISERYTWIADKKITRECILIIGMRCGLKTSRWGRRRGSAFPKHFYNFQVTLHPWHTAYKICR